jgi:hypothetical protein
MTTPSEEIITAGRLTILPTLTMTHRLTTHRASTLEDAVSNNHTLGIVGHLSSYAWGMPLTLIIFTAYNTITEYSSF